jgi:hypothetical protein
MLFSMIAPYGVYLCALSWFLLRRTAVGPDTPRAEPTG